MSFSLETPEQPYKKNLFTRILNLFSRSASNTDQPAEDAFELDFEVYYDTQMKVEDINIK